MKKIILCLMLFSLCGFNNSIYCQNPATETKSQDNAYVTDLDLALRLSKDTKQNVVLIFSADWCGFCKVLKGDLPTIDGFDDKIICILDSHKEKKLTRQFKAKSLPTSIMLNPNGQEVSRISGYNKVSYEKWLKSK